MEYKKQTLGELSINVWAENTINVPYGVKMASTNVRLPHGTNNKRLLQCHPLSLLFKLSFKIQMLSISWISAAAGLSHCLKSTSLGLWLYDCLEGGLTLHIIVRQSQSKIWLFSSPFWQGVGKSETLIEYVSLILRCTPHPASPLHIWRPPESRMCHSLIRSLVLFFLSHTKIILIIKGHLRFNEIPWFKKIGLLTLGIVWGIGNSSYTCRAVNPSL